MSGKTRPTAERHEAGVRILSGNKCAPRARRTTRGNRPAGSTRFGVSLSTGQSSPFAPCPRNEMDGVAGLSVRRGSSVRGICPAASRQALCPEAAFPFDAYLALDLQLQKLR